MIARLACVLLLLASASASADFWVVLGSFSSSGAAETGAREIGSEIRVEAIDGHFRLLQGPHIARADAEAARDQWRRNGYPDAWLLESQGPLSTSEPIAHTEAVEQSEPVSEQGSGNADSLTQLRRGAPADVSRGVRMRLRPEVVDALALDLGDADAVPELPVVPLVESGQLSRADTFKLTAVDLESPVLQDEIDELIAPLLGQRVGVEHLFGLRNRINQLLVQHGYINTGVTLPDQHIEAGVVRFDFVPGRVTRLEIESRLNERYIASRLNTTQPFNLELLQRALKQLEQDAMVETIHARVIPGDHPGEGVLELDVTTAPPYSVSITAANNRSPSIGAEHLVVEAGLDNLTGHADALRFSGIVSEGMDSHSVSWRMPINRHDHSVFVEHSVTDALVIEPPFDALDIESETESYRAGFRMPFLRDLSSHWMLEVTMEKRVNATTLLGVPYSFADGAVDGVSRVSPLRVALSWVHRGQSASTAARLSFTRGMSWQNASLSPGKSSTGFSAWLGQLQHSRQLVPGLQLTFKALAQRAADPLFSVEKFALGGMDTVRGYPQNQLVRDHALLASIEARYRLLSATRLDLVTFADWGRGEEHKRAAEQASDTIAGAGVGLSWRSRQGISAELYWAHAFDDFIRGDDLQDDGVHFRMSYVYRF